MPFEWLIGTRYLAETRGTGAPSVITFISVGAVSVGVAALIFVLAILGGFEGDLRNKILGTKAHLLVTGPSSRELVDFDQVLGMLDAIDTVRGASPFVESDVMVASASNYSGIVLRGIDRERLVTTSDMAEYMVEGRLEWLDDPNAALEAARAEGAAVDMEELRERAEALRRQSEELGEARDRLAEARERLEAVVGEQLGDGSGAAHPVVDGAGPDDKPGLDDGDAQGSGVGGTVAELPPPGDPQAGSRRRVGPPPLEERVGAGVAGADADRRVGPPPLSARLADAAADTDASEGSGEGSAEGSGGVPAAGAIARGPAPLEPGSRRVLPGIIIGTELRDTLHVDIGDQVQIINPDGDMGPTGPIPRAWPYRVVGVFYSGLYEYDNTMVYTTLAESRRFLNVLPEVVTGIEVRIDQIEDAPRVGASIEAALASGGRDDVKVATWMELNSRLFSALMLEQLVIGLLLMIIVLVASFAIVCVLIMIVIQRADEIAILRSMGAPASSIRWIFVVQGMSIGIAGTVIGLAIGLGLVAYLVYVGYPLDPNVYYIDRVPVESSWVEVVAVTVGALAISAVATLLPSMQAARLDPAAALRHE